VNWRIGSVPYLNARPLIYGIEDRVTLCEPSRLADLMYRGQFDVGLVPIAETLLHDNYEIISGMAIAARGPVRSVFLAHREPIERLKRVAVDPASRTSAWLVQVILKFGYNLEPEFYPRPKGAKLSEHEAMMLIGDEAIWYATRNGGQPVLDLGEAWVELTGLPFVFAAWALQRGIESKSLVDLLRGAKADGVAHIEQIVQSSTEATPEFRREYLTKHVWYELGDAERQGIRRFQQYVKDLGLVGDGHDLRYIG
jgi:predicted solute-binding protein